MARTISWAGSWLLPGLLLGAAVMISAGSHARVTPDDAPGSGDDNLYSGRARVYRELPPSSLEHITTADRLKRVASGNAAPTEIWRALEHGEKLECLDCIPKVENLLYNSDARVREISAWWLRRRIFGVFGKAEVYARTVATLTSAEAEPARRAYAAEALGEFLVGSGVKYLATALREDPSGQVRGAAARALRRLNSLGDGALVVAFDDEDPAVRAEALEAARKVHGFTEAAAVVKRFDDASPAVRLEAVKAAATLRSPDTVVPLIALIDASREKSALVRKSALFALARIGDDAAREAVRGVAEADPDRHVRDAARVALRSL